MKDRQRTAPDLQIRSLTTPAEIGVFFRLNASVFRPDEDTDIVAAQRQRYLIEHPDFHLHQLRGAFLGDIYVGGYALLERIMCLGPARLRTGCISGVVTHPDYRHQGIATALMQNAIHVAESQQYALLFLHGIGNFYQQFGYIDVLEDMSRHSLARKQLPETVSETYTVRTVTHADVPALLNCYQRHYDSYLGSFAPMRTLQLQEHVLFHWFEVTNDTQPLVVFNAEQELQGYLLLSRRKHKLYIYEVAADTWPATLALLHAHAQLLDAEPEPPQELVWPLPPTDPTFYFLADMPVRSELLSFPDGGWMARPVYLPTLLQSLLPLWQQYWQERSRLVDWTGTLALTIDAYTSFLEITTNNIYVVDTPSSSSWHITLSSNAFTQLIFGFRPISWTLHQSEQQVPVELIPVLNTLFPLGQAWVAGSDSF